MSEHGLVGKKLVREAMDVDCFLRDFALRVDVELQLIFRACLDQAPVECDAADFNEPVSVLRIEAGGFCVERIRR